MPHAALWVVQRPSCERGDHACRFQCRTRLCGWCSQRPPSRAVSPRSGFNAARGFVGGAALDAHLIVLCIDVSMPHAALWVVQLRRSQPLSP